MTIQFSATLNVGARLFNQKNGTFIKKTTQSHMVNFEYEQQSETPTPWAKVSLEGQSFWCQSAFLSHITKKLSLETTVQFMHITGGELGKALLFEATYPKATSRFKAKGTFGTESFETPLFERQFSLPLPLSWCEQMPNSQSKALALELTHFEQSGDEFSPKAKVIAMHSLHAGEASKPIIARIQVHAESQNGESHPHFYAGSSRVSWHASILPQFGASLVQTKVQVGSDVYFGESGQSAVLSTVGTLPFTLTAEDSRGNIATFSQSIEVKPYERPQKHTLNLVRCEKNGQESPSGHYFRLVGEAKCVGANPSYTLFVVANGKRTRLLPQGEVWGELSSTQSHNLELEVSDGIATSTFAFELAKFTTVMDFTSNALAVGGEVTTPHTFEVHFPLGEKLKQSILACVSQSPFGSPLRFVHENETPGGPFAQVKKGDEWLWQSVPPVVGKAFKTTRTHMGRPVFAQYIETTLPENATKTHTVFGAGSIIATELCHFYYGNGSLLPSITPSDSTTVRMHTRGNTLSLQTLVSGWAFAPVKGYVYYIV